MNGSKSDVVELQFECIGEYHLIKTLGKGGMGVVYLAEHTQTGDAVALKTVRVPSRTLIASIRREIRALAQLDHPGIIEIVAHGVHEGIPWYAMPYLDGISLAHVLSGQHNPTTLFERSVARKTDVEAIHHTQVEARLTSAEPVVRSTRLEHPDDDRRPGQVHHTAEEAVMGAARLEPVASIEDAVEIPEPSVVVRRRVLEDARVCEALFLITYLCDALAYLHGEGIVHRDLKPGNVMVREDRVVLVDFGLALRGGAERQLITKAFSLGGTATYMSPEQIDDAWIDARSDLYAIGCMIYEALAGRPPFVHEKTVEVLAMHRGKKPEPIGRFAEGLPPELEDLTMRLLAKRPEDRPGHVADVAAQLRDLLGLTPPESLERTPPRAFLYHPVLVERATELATLEAVFVEASEGQGGITILDGVSGVGKTRLAVELIRKVKRVRGEVLTGFCVAEEGQHRDFYALEGVMEEIADSFRGSDAEWEPSSLAALAPYFPVLKQSAEAEASPERAYRALSQVLIRLSDRKPLLVVLDDVHWADPLTLGWLLWLSEHRVFERARIMVLATSRSDEQHDSVSVLCDHPSVTWVSLGRLSSEGLATMTRSMLGLPSTPRNLARFLTRQTGGNPFFAAEYLRTAVSTGLFFRDRNGRWQVLYESEDDATVEIYENLPLPGALRQLVVRRMSDLSVREHKVLDAASVLGRVMQRGLLAVTCGTSAQEDAFLDTLTRLVGQHILSENEESGEVCFANETFREVAYERLSDARRRALHRDAARALEADSPDPARSAYHWERG